MNSIEKFTTTINTLRNEYQGVEFSNSTIRKVLANARIPYSTQVVAMVEFGILESPKKYIYKFSETPIYIKNVERFYLKAKQKANEYNKVHAEKNNPDNIRRIAVEEAIQVLKETGEYTIYKKVVKLEEI